MSLQQRITIILGPQEGLEKFEFLLGGGEDACLEQAFAKFILRVRSPCDPCTDAVLGGLFLAVDQRCTYRHREARRTLRRNVADGAGIDASRTGFQLTDQVHGPDLGSSRDRSAREQGTEDVNDRRRRVGRRAGGHLPHARVFFEGKFVESAHRAARETAEVIADHVEDHDVLRAVLFRAFQSLLLPLIFGKGHAARRRPLHRSGDEMLTLEVKKELR